MKATAGLLLLSIAACTHNRPFSAVHEVEGRVIVRTLDGQEQHATVVSTPTGKVFQSDSGATIDLGNVDKVTDQRMLRGALEGLGIGGGIGFGIGAVIGLASGDDEPCEDRHGYCVDFTAGEKAVLGGVLLGIVGGGVGLIAGAIRGSQFHYEGGEVPVVRPTGPPGSVVGVSIDF
jgi:hypothetical protein